MQTASRYRGDEAGAEEGTENTGPGPEAAIADWRGLHAVREEWKRLAGRAVEPNVFYDPDFALPAIDGLCLKEAARAVLVWDRGRAAGRTLAGVLPYVERRRWGIPVTVAEALIHPYAMSSAPLVAEDRVSAVVASLLGWLDAGRGGPAALLFRFLPADGTLFDMLGAEAERRSMQVRTFAAHERAVLDASPAKGIDAERASGKARKEHRRQRRRLGERGALTFTRAIMPGDPGPAMGEFLRLEASGWKGRAATAAASTPATERMFREIAAGLGLGRQCRIDALRLDGIAIAMTVSLGVGGRWWLWKIAYDEAFSRYSPGVLLVGDITEAALAGGGEHYDSCALPGHPMIEHAWRQRRPYVDLLLLPARLGSSMQAAIGGLESMRRQAESTARQLRSLARGG